MGVKVNSLHGEMSSDRALVLILNGGRKRLIGSYTDVGAMPHKVGFYIFNL